MKATIWAFSWACWDTSNVKTVLLLSLVFEVRVVVEVEGGGGAKEVVVVDGMPLVEFEVETDGTSESPLATTLPFVVGPG